MTTATPPAPAKAPIHGAGNGTAMPTPGVLPASPASEPPSLTPLPLRAAVAGLRRFTVAEYHKLIEIGVLAEGEKIELLNGYLVRKMSRNPPHDNTLVRAMMLLMSVIPPGWIVRPQCAITLGESEPEPDLAVAAGGLDTYEHRHPSPAELALVIEVADSSLATDRADKAPIYAGASVAEYWIVNIPDNQVEIYSRPSGPSVAPEYAERRTYRPGDAVPLPAPLGGATIPAADLLP